MKWENQILPFQYGMRAICNKPEDFPAWALLPGNDIRIRQTIENGLTVMDYEDIQNEQLCNLFSFEAEWNGFKVVALNGGKFNSKAFQSVYSKDKHHLMMPFNFDGRQWTVSLYTAHDDIDCSVLAKKRGGGGHVRAAGFQVLNFEDIGFRKINE